MSRKVKSGLVCCLLAALCLFPFGAAGAYAEGEQGDMNAYRRDTPIRKVINDPAFGDYGRLIFPVDEGYASGGTLGELGIDTEFHVYPRLSHGFGIGTGTAAEGWLDDAAAFRERQFR